jgi:hypothetical protein
MSDETNTTEQQPAAATADAALTPLAITETSVANEIARIERIMRIGFPVQVVFRDGRTFNGSYVQAGIIVGGPFKGGKALANIRVLTDAAPGEHPACSRQLPRRCCHLAHARRRQSGRLAGQRTSDQRPASAPAGRVTRP